jgi:GDP-4-dehydro-6-deoxy-D-mannose reductase
MRVLVLGAAGFAGRHLCAELLARGHTVLPAGRSTPEPGFLPRGCESWKGCDVTDPVAVRVALEAAAPEAVVALAGISSPPVANRDPSTAFRVNALGVVHLLEAIERSGARVRAAIVSSGEIYGPGGPSGSPIAETEPPRPASLYAVSKAAADEAARAYAARGLDVVVLRPFNHAGPGQARGFVCTDFASQVASVARGLRRGPIEVGDLDAVRDFTDVRDVVRGYALALERARSGEVYNLCSGRPVPVREILDGLCSIAGIAPEVRVAHDRRRPGEDRGSFGSREKAARELGWEPGIPLRRTLEDVLAAEDAALDGAVASGG